MYVSNRQVRWRRTEMTKEILKEKACAAIDAYADKIKAICASINDEPELGFKEVKTAAKVRAAGATSAEVKETAHLISHTVTPRCTGLESIRGPPIRECVKGVVAFGESVPNVLVLLNTAIGLRRFCGVKIRSRK